jgi:hypothetical protein
VDEVTSTLLGEGTDVDKDIVTVLVQMREDCRSIWTSLNSVLSTEDGADDDDQSSPELSLDKVCVTLFNQNQACS